MCYTTYNRTDMLFDSIEPHSNDERISEIIISDDASLPELFNQVKEWVDAKNNPKIKLHRNLTNQGVYRNKYHSACLASNKFCLMADSDNQYPKQFIDKIYEQVWEDDTILAPDWAMPQFNYTEFSGMTIDKSNVSAFIERPMGSTVFNTFNFFINREKYLSVWDASYEPLNFDSIYLNYCWIAAGNKFKVVDELRYEHLVHPMSHFQLHQRQGYGILDPILHKIKLLK